MVSSRGMIVNNDVMSILAIKQSAFRCTISLTKSSESLTLCSFEANLLKIVQNDVEIEPVLQKIDKERIDGRTGDNARPDI